MMNTGPVTLPGRPLRREMFCAVTVLLGKLSCRPARRVGVPGSAAVKAGEDRSVPAERGPRGGGTSWRQIPQCCPGIKSPARRETRDVSEGTTHWLCSSFRVRWHVLGCCRLVPLCPMAGEQRDKCGGVAVGCVGREGEKIGEGGF